VETDAELAEAEVAEGGLSAVDEREAFGIDFCAIGNTGSETGGRGTIPSGKASAAREFTDFGFAEADVEKRGENFVLGGGFVAGAEVECVVGVDAVSDRGDVFIGCELIEDREEFILAEIATVAIVSAVRGVIHFVSFDEFVANRKLLEEGSELITIVGGIAWRDGSDGKSAFAEGFVGSPCEISRIGTAGKSDDERREF